MSVCCRLWQEVRSPQISLLFVFHQQRQRHSDTPLGGGDDNHDGDDIGGDDDYDDGDDHHNYAINCVSNFVDNPLDCWLQLKQLYISCKVFFIEVWFKYPTFSAYLNHTFMGDEVIVFQKTISIFISICTCSFINNCWQSIWYSKSWAHGLLQIQTWVAS